jgi:CRISPR system Cascade subunit CasC
MLLELHILQNFAPANLNRDDTGSPKDCEFGGYRRARISSQCLKRAMRTAFKREQLLTSDKLAARTKRIVDELARRLELKGRDLGAAVAVAHAALTGLGLGVGDDGKTQYLLYLADSEIAKLAELCNDNWDQLAVATISGGSNGADPASGKVKASAKDAKKQAKGALPAELGKSLLASLSGNGSADLALFGRMLADLPDKNVDAACQVAHALSTNRISMEFDFYTAVDDLKPEDTAGADMLGTVEFNSACFYRYANVDLEQLKSNLGSQDLARETVRAFVRASVAAIPTGKQNSMAAQNPPSFVLAVARQRGLWSLANAFLNPVQPDCAGDLVQNSIKRLDGYWGRLTRMYGNGGVTGLWLCTTEDGCLEQLSTARLDGIDQLVDGLQEGIRFDAERGGALA